MHGNVEDAGGAAAPSRATAEVEVGGVRIGVVHDARPGGRPARAPAPPLPRRATGVVFGHSHIPLHEVADDGFLILNPGSPTDRRRAPRHTMAEIEVAPGRRPRRVAFGRSTTPAGPLDPGLVRGPPRGD